MNGRTNSKKWLVMLVCLPMIWCTAAAGRTIYVDDDGPADFNNIQAAINDANDGDIIIVADGTYTGTGNRDIDFLDKAITVRSKNGPESCIIDCGTAAEPHRGFYFHSGEDANSVLDGFTITNGHADQGGGIYCSYSSPTVTNCAFSGNRGGGMFNAHSNPKVTNCVFNANWGYSGGGMFNDSHSSPRVDNCIFSGNSTESIGGGIYNVGNPTLTNCIFSGNSARYGAGIFNCLPGSPTLINCTFSRNSAVWGGGIANFAIRTPTLTNCILWGDFPEEIYGHPPVITYSDVQGGWPGEGNIDADPLFVDANGGDYHLRAGSPCIDVGTNNPPGGLPETDLDGKRRIINAIVDMGAFEFGGEWYVDRVNGDDNNDGLSPETAFATIQKGIDSAGDNYTVLVYPGVYQETIDFLGKAITVKSATDAAVLEASDYFAVLFYSGEGRHSVLKNFVIRNSFIAIFLEGSSPTISNVTVADNAFGIAAYAGAEPDISNSIFWNNIYGDLFGCQARYSCIQEAGEGQGNLNINPLFADSENGDYHLLSRCGRYWPEYDVWVLDDVISPCIDGGDPNADYFNEPKPNGGRVNMGAYGGTAYASMKEIRWVHGDANHDGWVNMIDFAMLAKNWLKYKAGTSNLLPEVAIIKPQDGDRFSREETIEIEADAWDADGLVKKVEFFANGSNIDEDTDGVDGWKIYWMEHPLDTYSLTAEATDDDGATTTSPAVEIQIDLR